MQSIKRLGCGLPCTLVIATAIALGGPAVALAVQDGAAAPQQPPAPASGPLTVVDELRRRDELLWQRAVAKMNEASRLAREAVAAENFDQARQLSDQAVQEIEAARAYAEPLSKYETARQQALALRDEVNTAWEQYQIRKAREEREQIATRVEDRKRRQEQQRQDLIEQLFNTADQLRKEARYREAAETVRQVLSIDPSNAKAIHQLDVYEDFASLHEQSEIDHAYRSEGRGALIDAEEAKIPWYSDVLYPKNWLEITTRRKALEAGAGTSDEDADLNRVLDMQQDEVNFTDTPLVQAVDFLKDVNRVNVTVDWDDLADVGVDRERPISLSLRSIPLRTAFKELLNQAGGEAALGFAVRDGVLRIATRRTLDRDKHVVVYDIRDLLVDMPRFVNAPTLDLADSFKESGGGVSPARRDLFTTESPDDPDKALVLAQHDARVQEMLDIIRTNVAPDSWRETGGGDGALRELNGELIVYNTSDAHQQVTSLLDQLRETRALQISVESRFLIVSSNFLEEIGVDLDFVFNAGNASFDRVFDAAGVPVVDPFSGAAVLMPRQFSSIGATPAVPPFGNPLPQINVRQPYGQAGFVPQQGTVIPSFQDTTPIPLQQNSLALTNPQGLNTGIPGSLTDAVAGSPAMTIAGSFLDNLQVDFLIRATQANRRASIVQAPRLLMFNGQRANVVISRQRQYVSSLQPVVAEGAVGVTPIIGVVSSGVVLDVEGTIDHERKYVTLTVRTSLAQEPRLTPFEVQRGSGTSPSLFITLVDQETRRINTTVSVPDGGTVLLGGLKSSGEIEIDAGVPILSKLPVLKRAFTNSTTVKDTQTLLILLKSKILIQREAEEEAFPTLSNAGG